MELVKKALLIDSNPGDARRLEELVAAVDGNGFSLEWVESFSRGIEALDRDEFDVILLDLSLPDGNGIHSFITLKTRVPEIPIIVLGRKTDDLLAGSVLQAGAQDFLSKDQLGCNALVRSLCCSIERKRIENMNKEAMNFKSHFISIVSHELRTPLTTVKESLRIVLDGTVGNLVEQQREMLKLAQRNVFRLIRLVDDVVVYRKLESGCSDFAIENHDMNDVIREVSAMMVHLAHEKGLDLVFDLSPDVPEIMFDRDRIVQVLTHLIDNAIKFTTAGSIRVVTARSGNIIRVSVTDTGKGIDRENMSRLFREFEQFDSLNERNSGGAGLGLAISREIIIRHGGRIWAESEPGSGTKVHFLLPIVERRRGSILQ